MINISSDEEPTPIGFVNRSTKRREENPPTKYSDHEYESELGAIDDDEVLAINMKQIRIDQVKKTYYHAAICSMSQLALKDVLTALINVCHPQKQSQYPYNGGRSRLRSLTEHGYEGHYTMPDYWPSDKGWNSIDGIVRGCRHKEPYHLNRFGISTGDDKNTLGQH